MKKFRLQNQERQTRSGWRRSTRRQKLEKDILKKKKIRVNNFVKKSKERYLRIRL